MSKHEIEAAREAYLAQKEATKCPPGTAFGGHSQQRRVNHQKEG